MSYAYPIFLDVSHRRIVIVGGGAVAARKASALLAAGATDLLAVAPKFVASFPKEPVRKLEEFAPQHLDGAQLVFAATDAVAVNNAVVAEAHRRGLLAQRADADDADPGDFISPALLRSGNILVAISAGGSPALAASLRDRLADGVTSEWILLADILKRIRPRILAAGLPAPRRREILRALAGSQAADILAASGPHGFYDWAAKQFPELPPLTELPA